MHAYYIRSTSGVPTWHLRSTSVCLTEVLLTYYRGTTEGLRRYAICGVGRAWLSLILKPAVETMKPQINTDADAGEGIHLAGEASLLGNTLQIRLHLGSSVVELENCRPEELLGVVEEDQGRPHLGA